MSLIPAHAQAHAQRTIASATAILAAAVIATGAASSLRAQSLSPAQGGFDAGSLSAPSSAGALGGSPLSPDGAGLAPDGGLPSALAPSGPGPDDLMDDGGQAPLAGAIANGDYIAPQGTYRIRIPVYPELGGQVSDTSNVVTFQDAFGEIYSIGAFPVNNDFRLEEAKSGHKGVLVWFFQNFIEADFQRNIPNTTAEPNARYNANTQGGALFSILRLPDGSAYMDRVFVFPPKEPVIAKRGNLVFVRDGFVYALSTELSERIFEYGTWKKTAAEEEDILRQRLYDLLSRIVFTKPGSNAGVLAMPTAPANVTAPAPANANRAAPAPTPAFTPTPARAAASPLSTMPAVSYPAAAAPAATATPAATGTRAPVK